MIERIQVSKAAPISQFSIPERTFHSAALGCAMPYSVFIPPGETPAGGWPLVLLLHGAGRNHRTIADDPVCRPVVLRQKFVVVFPAGGGWYIGSHQAVIRELLTVARTELPVSSLPASTGICGWSMGGYGAVRFAEAFPQELHAVASGIGLLDYPNKDLPVKEFAVDACFGNDAWVIFNCLTHAEQLRDHEILIIAATEAWDYQQNENFHARLEKLGIAHDYRRIAGGHSFESVRVCVPQWLKFMERSLTPK